MKTYNWKRKTSDKRDFKDRNPSNLTRIKLWILDKFRGFDIRNLRKPILIIIVLIGMAICSYLLFTQARITQFEIYGTEQVSKETISSTLEQFKGNSFIAQDLSEIRSSVSTSNTFLRDIYVEKVFPNKISLQVIERYPDNVIINFSGAYLIDQEDKILEILAKTEKLELSDKQIEILNGYATYEHELVEKKIKEDLLEEAEDREEREEIEEDFDFDEISTDKKQEVFGQLKNEINQKVQNRIQSNSRSVSTTEFANLQRVYIFSDQEFEVGDHINSKFTFYPEEFRDYFLSKDEFTIDKLIWENNFSLRVETLEGVRFIFTDQGREVWEQTRSLDLALTALERRSEQFTVIDVSGRSVTYK